MNRAYVDECLLKVAEGLPPFDPVVVNEVLMTEYISRYRSWPDSTRTVFIVVMAALTRHIKDSHDSSVTAADVLNRIKKKK